MDAAHGVCAPFLGYLWSLSRLFVRAPAGRKRFHVRGALNAITPEVLTVTHAAYMNAQSVWTVLRQLAAWPVNRASTLVVDNAREQTGALGQGCAAVLPIARLSRPASSPTVKLRERVWECGKKPGWSSKD
jgi:hypothetical protein